MSKFLSDSDITEIINIVTKNGKGIRKSKPKVDKNLANTGRAAYVHRHVMFVIGSGHWSCIPSSDIFNFNDADWENYRSHRKEFIDELHVVVDKIVATVPKSEWRGIKRWGRALGVL